MKKKSSALTRFSRRRRASCRYNKRALCAGSRRTTRGSIPIAPLRHWTRGFFHVDHQDWSVSSESCRAHSLRDCRRSRNAALRCSPLAGRRSRLCRGRRSQRCRPDAQTGAGAPSRPGAARYQHDRNVVVRGWTPHRGTLPRHAHRVSHHARGSGVCAASPALRRQWVPAERHSRAAFVARAARSAWRRTVVESADPDAIGRRHHPAKAALAGCRCEEAP